MAVVQALALMLLMLGVCFESTLGTDGKCVIPGFLILFGFELVNKGWCNFEAL